jgi:hypothetical protein
MDLLQMIPVLRKHGWMNFKKAPEKGISGGLIVNNSMEM